MKLRRTFFWSLILILFMGCFEKPTKPKFIFYQYTKDSLHVYAKNSLLCPVFIKILQKDENLEEIIDLQPNENQRILAFSTQETDSIQLLKNYSFSGLWYGKSVDQPYDTLYNYALPFLKGKQYKILQGQNTNFTHKGDFSRYALDFKMNIGQTVCSIRDGVVVDVKDSFNKGGKDKKYRPYANLIIIYHKDGTFSQYVHLKQNSAMVKVGDSVQKGQKIAQSGNTGMTTEPHLHFAVYRSSQDGLKSIPYILDSIPTAKYTKGKYAVNN